MQLRTHTVLVLALASTVSSVFAQSSTQTVTLADSLQIPGATLAPGSYRIAVEDRLKDRAIVRITNAGSDQHYLLLTVPNSKLTGGEANRLILFRPSGTDKQQVLRGWNCAGCSAPLELVYPKLEAVSITDKTTEPVMAVDPEYDKLPANLTADDMKVVSLWLLAPEHITADNVGQGVKAVKYVPDENQMAQAAPPATPAPTQMASTASDNVASPAPSHRTRLPKTASDTYLLGLLGSMMLLGGLGLRVRRMYRVNS